MSNDFNKVIVTGRLVKDPIKTTVPTQNGEVNLLKFTIANQLYKSDKTNYFDCEYWGKGADFFADRLSKGSLILIEGELKYTKWIDKKTNENRSKIVINVQNINFLSFDKNFQLKSSKEDNNEFPKKIDDSKLIVKNKYELDGEPLIESAEDPFSSSEIDSDNYDFDSDMNDFENDDNIYYK